MIYLSSSDLQISKSVLYAISSHFHVLIDLIAVFVDNNRCNYFHNTILQKRRFYVRIRAFHKHSATRMKLDASIRMLCLRQVMTRKAILCQTVYRFCFKWLLQNNFARRLSDSMTRAPSGVSRRNYEYGIEIIDRQRLIDVISWNKGS